MAKAGVNLRQEDIESFIAACNGRGIDHTTIPVLYILHDDTEQTLDSCLQAAENAQLNIAIYRCMTPNSRLAPLRLPVGAHIIGWNEADQPTDWWDSWWKWVRTLSNNLVIHYGAPNVNNQWPENAPLEAALDVVDRHIGSTFSPPTPTIEGKPVSVTEVDIDPNRFTWGDPNSMSQAYTELISCMKNCLAAGEDVYAWGILQDQPDAAISLKVLVAIRDMNDSPKSRAEAAYNTLTGGAPFIPGKQYVQDNSDGSYTVVVTYAG